jgi:ribosomal subunit interface protein
MDVRITTRRVELTNTFLEHAEERTRKLIRYEPRLLSIELLFEEESGRVVTEARADVPGRPIRVARGSASDRRASLDQTLKKLGRQLCRERDRRVEHKGAVPPEAPIPAVVEE